MLSRARGSRRREDPVARVDITSLIDIVFLLLIFLIVVMITAYNEVRAELDLPEANQANPEAREERDRLIVNLDRYGHLSVMNMRLTLGELSRLLAEAGAKSLGPDGYSERPVYIRAHEDRPFGEVQDIMGACRDARIWKLSLRAEPPERAQR